MEVLPLGLRAHFSLHPLRHALNFLAYLEIKRVQHLLGRLLVRRLVLQNELILLHGFLHASPNRLILLII